MHLIECEKCKGNRVISKKNKWKCMECRHEWELNKMPTKHIMTRAEAIDLCADHMAYNKEAATKIIDFYVAAGMLEIKEEEENHMENALTDAMRNAGSAKELLQLLNIKGYKIAER